MVSTLTIQVHLVTPLDQDLYAAKLHFGGASIDLEKTKVFPDFGGVPVIESVRAGRGECHNVLASHGHFGVPGNLIHQHDGRPQEHFDPGIARAIADHAEGPVLSQSKSYAWSQQHFGASVFSAHQG